MLRGSSAHSIIDRLSSYSGVPNNRDVTLINRREFCPTITLIRHISNHHANWFIPKFVFGFLEISGFNFFSMNFFFLYFDWFWRENRFGNWLCNIARLRNTCTHKTQVLNTSLDCTELDLTDLKVTKLYNEKKSKRVWEVELWLIKHDLEKSLMEEGGFKFW